MSTQELAERSRWEERYGEPLKRDHKLYPGFVQIGDEFFSVDELERADKEHPQPANDPFKPHHYLVQEALDDLLSYYKTNPTRKMVIK
jgi:hypothetical protein